MESNTTSKRKANSKCLPNLSAGGRAEKFEMLAIMKAPFWSTGLVGKMLDSQSTGPMFKTIGCLQGQLSFSSFRGQ